MEEASDATETEAETTDGDKREYGVPAYANFLDESLDDDIAPSPEFRERIASFLAEMEPLIEKRRQSMKAVRETVLRLMVRNDRAKYN